MLRRPVFVLVVSTLLLAGAAAQAQTPPAGAPMQGPGQGPGQEQGAGPGGAPGGPPGGGLAPPRERSEVAPWSDRVFGRLDANQDGFLTGSELTILTQGPMGAAGGARLRTVIAQSDTSGDSRISREEMAAGMERMFTRMDRNGDGRLAGDELPQPPAQARPPAIPMPTQPDPMPMPEGMSGG